MPIFTIKGKDTMIDEIDIPLLESHPWFWLPQGYLATKIPAGKGKRKTVCFHRMALGDPDSQSIDHINRDKADNRRFNLRPCTHSQNNLNRGFLERGVTFCATRQKWQVVVRENGKLRWLGYFNVKEDAESEAKRFYDVYAPDFFRVKTGK